MLNYRRGFLRIYLVLAACWAPLWLYLAASDLIQERRVEVATTRLLDRIEEAHRNGYGDDEIVNHLENRNSEFARLILQKKQSGRSSADILAFLEQASVHDLLANPRFRTLPGETRRSILSRLDRDFANLPPKEQDKVLDFKPSQPKTVEIDPKLDYDALAKKYGATIEVDPNALFDLSGLLRDLGAGEVVIKQHDYHEVRFSLEMGLIPPAVGYLLLFVIVPWIGNGFRSST
jgi:hypothetical protein